MNAIHIELWQALILFAALIAAGLYVYKRITGIDCLHAVAMSKPVVLALASAVEALSKLWKSDVLKIVYQTLRAGVIGAETAEKLWLAGDLEKDERNVFAKKLAENVLGQAGFPVTDQMQMVISGIIEAACMLLPHGKKPKTKEEAKDTQAVTEQVE